MSFQNSYAQKDSLYGSYFNSNYLISIPSDSKEPF